MDYGAVWGTFLAFLFLTVYFIWIMAKEINENREKHQRFWEIEKKKIERNLPLCELHGKSLFRELDNRMSRSWDDCERCEWDSRRVELGLLPDDVYFKIDIVSEAVKRMVECREAVLRIKMEPTGIGNDFESVRGGYNFALDQINHWVLIAYKGLENYRRWPDGFDGDELAKAIQKLQSLENYIKENGLFRIDKEGNDGTERPANPD